MDKKVINEEQFKKLVINEAKKVMAKNDNSSKKNTSKESDKFSFNKVEKLISEMETVNKSITSIIKEDEVDNKATLKSEGIGSSENKGEWAPNEKRDLDVIEHNKKKNIIHVNENEKDKWKRMMDYEVPDDEKR